MEELMQNTKKPTIIGIAGGTSSGKTTIANRLYDEAIKTGTVALIKIDDYYHNKDKVQRTEQWQTQGEQFAGI